MHRDREPRRLQRGRRRWPAVAMGVGTAVTLIAGGRIATVDYGSKAKSGIIREAQLTLGVMDEFGEISSRDVAWRGHEMQGLGTRSEHHATFTIAKQKSAATDNGRFVASFADAHDMTDPFDSRELRHSSVQVIDSSDGKLLNTLNLTKMMFRDKKTNETKLGWEASITLERGKKYDFVVTTIDQFSGGVREFVYRNAVLPDFK